MRHWNDFKMKQKLKNDALWCKSAKNLAICFIYEVSINLWCDLTTAYPSWRVTVIFGRRVAGGRDALVTADNWRTVDTCADVLCWSIVINYLGRTNTFPAVYYIKINCYWDVSRQWNMSWLKLTRKLQTLGNVKIPVHKYGHQ